MIKTTLLLFYISIFILLFIILITTYFIVFQYSEFITFAENNITDDGVIDFPANSIARLYGLFCFCLIVLFLTRYVKPSLLAVDHVRLKACYTIIGIMIVVHFFWADNRLLYFEDGIMEYLTVILALISTILFLLTSKKIGGQSGKVLFLISFLLILFALEEISWGQRLAGWETPELLKKINHQQELNIHNIFNFLVPLIYVLFFSSLSLIFLFRDKILKLIDSRPKYIKLKWLIPGQQFYYFGFIFLFLAGYSLFRGGELLEEIFSIFIVFYSVDLLKKTRKLKFK